MNYDRNILIKNICQLMKDNDITQNDLAQISNTHQNRVSICLNGKGDFTIPQLIDIASHFDVSLDDLLGLKSEHKEDTKYETYSDIFKIFFSLADSLDITIRDMTVSDIYGSDSDVFPSGYDSRFDSLIQRAVSFSDDVIINVLGEWRTAVEEMEQLTGGKKLYETWKQGILSEYNFKVGSQSPNSANDTKTESTSAVQSNDDFMNIPDKELPFS